MGRDLSLAPGKAYEAIRRLQPLADDLVLIGGQAVAVWAERYMGRVPELAADAPFTTKDIDFIDTAEQAERSAELLQGSCRTVAFGHRTQCTAIVVMHDGTQVDFLQAPFGFAGLNNIITRSLTWRLGRIMHPMDVLISRTANVAELPKYQDDRALKQLRAAVHCVREFASDMIEEARSTRPQGMRHVLRLSEEVFDLAASDNGLQVFAEHGVDLVDAVVVDDRMPEEFRARRFPQIRQQLASKRSQWGAQAEARARLRDRNTPPPRRRSPK